MHTEELKKTCRDIVGKIPSRIYLIGVGGAGMSGLARLLLELGHQVSGSDLRRNAEIGRLEHMGMTFFQGHEGSQVEGCDLVAYTSAVNDTNPEMQRAAELGIPTTRRAKLLAVLAERKKALVVAGMHGKTTTASMLAYVLRSAGRNCSHYIGADVPLLGASAAWGEGEHFVIEVDESDGTIELFHPNSALILNIEEEHLDYYGNLDRIMEVFGRVIEQTDERILYCADDKNAVLLCSGHRNSVSYGFSDLADYQIIELKLESFSARFKIVKGNVLLGALQLNVPGIKNVSNAAGVAALATELGVNWDSIRAAMKEFRGAARRFDVKYKSDDFMVVDDYAHHPTEIKATLSAASHGGWKRIVALFQPHRYSRTQLLMNEFGAAFKDCDVLHLTEIYAASEMPIEGVSGEILAEHVRESGEAEVSFSPSLGRLHSDVARSVQPGDLILTMGAGDIHKVATRLAQELEVFGELRKKLKPESVLLRHESMAKHTTMRIGGPADLWFEPTDEADLAEALRFAHSREMPVTLIGRGSNLLVLDGGIRGMCVHLGQPFFRRIEIEGDTITVGAGARLKEIVQAAKKHGIGGIEFMEGIPGNLGGALRMNAGAMQGWTMEVVEEVRAMDMQGNVHTHRSDELEVYYRSVPHFEQHIGVSARLRGEQIGEEAIAERLKQYSAKRWSSQPAAPSAGCIFKNPGETPAGKLIDELGLKNTSMGGARVSDVHGNFIVNEGGATANDVLDLISVIKRKAREERNIELQTEVQILGEPLD